MMTEEQRAYFLRYYHEKLKNRPAYREAQRRRNLKHYALHSKDPQFLKRQAERSKRDRYDPRLRMRHEARWMARRAVKAGRIKREPCACGEPKAEMHHHDYNKPLEVEWLCLKCHVAKHQQLNSKD